MYEDEDWYINNRRLEKGESGFGVGAMAHSSRGKSGKVCDHCEEPLDAQDELELLPNEKALCRSCKESDRAYKDHVKGVIGYEDPDGVKTSTWLPY